MAMRQKTTAVAVQRRVLTAERQSPTICVVAFPGGAQGSARQPLDPTALSLAPQYATRIDRCGALTCADAQ
ncbi:hypothetical protein SAMN05216252_107201 [Actinacidiphila glaucinigra]|uniref:Uncharacterized protein n=1 Tax=Actinacidiphila glaucinigra TaxID=235986 RepID=A0A239G3V1_9ACTN|nr:hypothetical protein SAMN05216252_107201 [Actinacidiphila glaucinigra]